MATIIFFLSLRSKPLKTFLYAIIPLRLKAGSSSRKPASLLLILLLLILKSRIPRSGSWALPLAICSNQWAAFLPYVESFV
jgi:hypothetical protein